MDVCMWGTCVETQTDDLSCISLHLTVFEAWSLTEPEAHQFGWAG